MLLVTHVTAADVGAIPGLLADLGRPTRVMRANKGEPFPQDVEALGGVVSFGGTAERERRSHRLRARGTRLDTARDGGRCAAARHMSRQSDGGAYSGRDGGAGPRTGSTSSATTRSSRWTVRPKNWPSTGYSMWRIATARRSRSPPVHAGLRGATCSRTRRFATARRPGACSFIPRSTTRCWGVGSTSDPPPEDLERNGAQSVVVQHAKHARYHRAMHDWLGRFLALWLASAER